jgi:hypothetical protein
LQLGDGETLEGNPVVVFVDAAGTSNPTNSNSGTISRVWLSGGTHGGRAVFTVAVTTSGGRTLERAFGVDVVDNAIGVDTAEDDYLATLALPALREMRASIWTALSASIAGSRVKEVWRDGRRIVRDNMGVKELREMLAMIDRTIAEVEDDMGMSRASRRRAIAIQWA